MAEASDKRGLLRENLQDAGCAEPTLSQCLALAERGEARQLLGLLAQHKRSLLDGIHQSERCVDCLDFLVYQIKHGQVMQKEEV